MSRLLKGALGAAVIGVVLSLAGASTAFADTSTVQARDGYPCDLYFLCGWDETGPWPATKIINRTGNIACGETFTLELTMQNRLGSINNMTTGSWELKDGNHVVFFADENSWGNLPVQAQNNVDNIRFICT